MGPELAALLGGEDGRGPRPGVLPLALFEGLELPADDLDVADELADVLLPDALLARHGREEVPDVDLLLEQGEGGHAVGRGVRRRSGMEGAVTELERRPPLFGEDVDPPLAGHDHAGAARVLVEIGEDLLPVLVPADVLDVEDDPRDGFVELERLDPELGPGQDGVRHGLDPAEIGPGRQDERQGRGREEAGQTENEERTEEPPGPDPERPERDDLGVGGQARQTAQDARQDGHGHGEGQQGRDEQDEEAGRRAGRDAPDDEELGQGQDLVHEQGEGRDQEADQERRHDLLENVPVDDLEHGPRLPQSYRIWPQPYKTGSNLRITHYLRNA